MCSASSPANQVRDGRYHPLQVKVIPPKGLNIPSLRPYFRRGYLAPNQ